MTGMSLFLHSLRQVFGNFDAAVRISIPAAVMMVVMYLMAPGLITAMVAPEQILTDQTTNYRFIFFGVIALVVGILWTAVAWHRYILREETPGALPEFHGSAILSYLGWSVLIGIIMALFGMLMGGIIGILMGTIGMSFQSIARWVPIFTVLPITYLAYRLSLVLPSRALGEGLRLEQSWQATESASGAIFGLSVIALVVALVADILLFSLFANLGTVPLLVAYLLYQWVYMMVGISILSTLYGVCVEKRELVV